MLPPTVATFQILNEANKAFAHWKNSGCAAQPARSRHGGQFGDRAGRADPQPVLAVFQGRPAHRGQVDESGGVDLRFGEQPGAAAHDPLARAEDEIGAGAGVPVVHDGVQIHGGFPCVAAWGDKRPRRCTPHLLDTSDVLRQGVAQVSAGDTHPDRGYGASVATSDAELMVLLQGIVADDSGAVSALLAASPELAMTRVAKGATRQAASENFLVEIEHYIYAGDTALHVAAAAYRPDLVRLLVATGADVGARNRRGAQPLHYAADGSPGSMHWNPGAQAATVASLIEAGADPNATDKNGVTPLHRAIRTRCAAAVSALLDGGADAERPNAHGSTPLQLATWTTGRGGSGSPESKAQQEQILDQLERRAAAALKRVANSNSTSHTVNKGEMTRTHIHTPSSPGRNIQWCQRK